MAKLALLGGRPLTKNLLAKSSLVRCRDLERKYLLEAYDSGVWDDWLPLLETRFQVTRLDIPGFLMGPVIFHHRIRLHHI